MHTFILSKVISPTIYRELLNCTAYFQINTKSDFFDLYVVNNNALPLTKDEQHSMPTIYLYHFQEVRTVNGKEVATGKHHHMLEIRVNYDKLVGRAGYYSFPAEFVKTIMLDTMMNYVCKVLPPLCNIFESDMLSECQLRRIDYSYDIYTEYHEQLLTLIGYGYTEKRFKNNANVYYNKQENVTESIYCKSQSVHVNIYNKLLELNNNNVSISEEDIDRSKNLLRVEVQVLRNRLYYMIQKEKKNENIIERKLEDFLNNSLEYNTLNEYLSLIVGKGNYYCLDVAKEIINNSDEKNNMKEKLCKVLDYVARYHGITGFLKKVEKGIITDCGKLDTVKGYLRKLHDMDINPVTISRNMQKELKEIVPQDSLPDKGKYKHGIDFLYNPCFYLKIQYMFAEQEKFNV